MQQLIYFFQKYRYFFFFLLLEIVALGLTVNNHAFHKSKFVSSANAITGGFYNKINSLTDYFHLRDENKNLIKENTRLKNEVERLREALDTREEQVIVDSVYNHQYQYLEGKIISHQYSSRNNFLLINLGLKDSITTEMAVVNSKGVIGITENVSQNYTRVQSILNSKSNINARLKNNSFHFGTIRWDGKNYNIVQLSDIPRQTIVKKGDTVITGGKSSIFPEGIPIGKVLEVKEGGATLTKLINIQLFNDMSDLKNMYVIKNFDRKEIKYLELREDE